MKFQCIRGLSRRNPHTGRTTTYKVGQRIGQQAYNRLTTRQQQEHFLSARAAARKVPYLRSEVQQLVNLYLELNGSLETIRSAFLEANPNTQHTAESIRSAAGQLRSLDTYYPNDNNWVAKSLFREVAAATNAERFAVA